MTQNPYHVLFISPSRLGDAVLSTCLLEGMRQRYGALRVTVVAPSFLHTVFRSMPDCHCILPFVKRSFSRHWFDLWREVKDTPWDIVVDTRGSVMSYMLKARHRYIWSKKYKTASVHINSFLPSEHRVMSLNAMMKAQNLILPKLCVGEDALDAARAWIDQPTLAWAPTANWVGKQWPLPYVIKLMGRFFQSTQDTHNIVLMGAPHEALDIQSIVHAFDHTPFAERIKVCLSPDLEKVAAVLSCCDAFLGNDSGLMHMAAALNLPAIALFGPTPEAVYGPATPSCYIIRGRRSYEQITSSKGFRADAHVSYMDDISLDQVWDTLDYVWNGMHARMHDLESMPLHAKI